MDFFTFTFGVLSGGLAGLGYSYVIYFLKSRDEKKFKASIIYYDLKSIEYYFSNEINNVSNIRFSTAWQENLAYCDFLSNKEVQSVYSIYDSTYDYNEKYKKYETDKEKIILFNMHEKHTNFFLINILPIFEKKYKTFNKKNKSSSCSIFALFKIGS